MKLVFTRGGQQEVDDYEETVWDTEMEQYLQGYLYSVIGITNSVKLKMLRPDP